MSLRSIIKSRRTAALGVAAAGVAGIVLAANPTGAFFSDSHDGSITGTIGSIQITPSGGSGAENMNFNFANMLPGEPQTATLTYENTGSNPEDVWVTFPNATALSALNNLGTYGEIHVVSNGVERFASANLNDRASTCGAFTPSGCWPLKDKIKLASNVAPGGRGQVKVTFAYADKLKGQPPAGTTAYFNAYPVSGQTTTNAADGTGNGLPYQLVATQVGQQP